MAPLRAVMQEMSLLPERSFMVSLSNHEATRAAGAAKPSWFDPVDARHPPVLTMKAFCRAAPIAQGR
jgi:hypothetical protein